MAGINPSTHTETPRHPRQLSVKGPISSPIRSTKGHAGTEQPDAINGTQNKTKEITTDRKNNGKNKENIWRQALKAGNKHVMYKTY